MMTEETKGKSGRLACRALCCSGCSNGCEQARRQKLEQQENDTFDSKNTSHSSNYVMHEKVDAV